MKNLSQSITRAKLPALASLAIIPILTTSCLSRRDRKTVEIEPVPVGAVVNPGDPAVPATPDPAAPVLPVTPPYSLEDAIKYEVQAGDSLSGISSKYGVPIKDIKLANKLDDINKIRAGDTLLLPNKEAAVPAEISPVTPEAETAPAETAPAETVPAIPAPSDDTSGAGLTLPGFGTGE